LVLFFQLLAACQYLDKTQNGWTDKIPKSPQRLTQNIHFCLLAAADDISIMIEIGLLLSHVLLYCTGSNISGFIYLEQHLL
jgi:hypothetical protein